MKERIIDIVKAAAPYLFFGLYAFFCDAMILLFFNRATANVLPKLWVVSEVIAYVLFTLYMQLNNRLITMIVSCILALSIVVNLVLTFVPAIPH